MGSGSVSVRLPEEVIRELDRVARLQDRKVSDVVRDYIVAGLTGGGNSNVASLREYIESLGGLLMVLTNETVTARYFAHMTTNYALDMENLLRENKVMEPKTKSALLKKFEAAARKQAEETLEQVGPTRRGGND